MQEFIIRLTECEVLYFKWFIIFLTNKNRVFLYLFTVNHDWQCHGSKSSRQALISSHVAPNQTLFPPRERVKKLGKINSRIRRGSKETRAHSQVTSRHQNSHRRHCPHTLHASTSHLHVSPIFCLDIPSSPLLADTRHIPLSLGVSLSLTHSQTALAERLSSLNGATSIDAFSSPTMALLAFLVLFFAMAGHSSKLLASSFPTVFLCYLMNALSKFNFW